MGVGGPKPDLVAQRLGASNVPDRAPTGDVVELLPPDQLSPKGRVVWDTVVPVLVKSRVLREEDLLLVVEACEAWALVTHFRVLLWREIDGSNDPAEIKRLRTSWADALRLAKSLSQDLGIGPVSRMRIGLAEAGAASLLAQLGEEG